MRTLLTLGCGLACCFPTTRSGGAGAPPSGFYSAARPAGAARPGCRASNNGTSTRAGRRLATLAAHLTVAAAPAAAPSDGSTRPHIVMFVADGPRDPDPWLPPPSDEPQSFELRRP